MKKLLLILLLTTISINAVAEWDYFGTTSANDKFYLDFSTLKSNGNLRKIWYRVIYTTPTKFGDLAEKTQAEFNCKNDTWRILHLVTYTDIDLSNISSNIANKDKTWAPLVPESITQDIQKLLCQKK